MTDAAFPTGIDRRILHIVHPDIDRSAVRRRDRWREFERVVVTWALITGACIGIWLIRGADGVISLPRRDIELGFWPVWPLVIGFFVVSFRAWKTFARDDDDEVG